MNTEKQKHKIKLHKKTKKIKKNNPLNHSKIWESIKNEESQTEIKEDELECIYEKDNVFETNKCKTCNSHLFVGDEGFLFCSNKNCGIFCISTIKHPLFFFIIIYKIYIELFLSLFF